ncbi:MAG: thioredoxin [Chloroflexota bacterium]|nr:thioredoxin [Chloroflexota bacterium]
MADFLEVTDSSFESEVLQADKPTLVDFWAEWCGPCKMVAPVVEEIAAEYDGKLQVAKMDVDGNRETPASYGIQGIPTLILFKDGEEATRIIGFRPKQAVLEELLPHL